MRGPKRIDTILSVLKRIWKKYPDLRLGQIIVNITDPGAENIDVPLDHFLFYVEDDILLENLLQWEKEQS